MDLFPAIDIRNGKAVRLFQGDYDQMTVYEEDPAAIARGFRRAGASHLHLVDLDGAKDGALVNFETIRRVAAAADLFVEVGGGIRDEERIRQYLDCGVDRVILGTIAVRDPGFVAEMVGRYGEKIAVGVDARDGKVAVGGWKETTDLVSFEFCRAMRDMGVRTVIYTDISKDGAMAGTNMDAYRRLAELQGLSITASGGISTEEEILALSELVDAAILGKALYSGLLDLERCVRLTARG